MSFPSTQVANGATLTWETTRSPNYCLGRFHLQFLSHPTRPMMQPRHGGHLASHDNDHLSQAEPGGHLVLVGDESMGDNNPLRVRLDALNVGMHRTGEPRTRASWDSARHALIMARQRRTPSHRERATVPHHHRAP